MNTITDTTTTTIILAEGHFERGADILSNGEVIYRVPAFTHWDDSHIRIIDRLGEAIAQKEEREFYGSRSWSTGIWRDIASLGKVDGLEVVTDTRD